MTEVAFTSEALYSLPYFATELIDSHPCSTLGYCAELLVASYSNGNANFRIFVDATKPVRDIAPKEVRK
jgi:hypothetical protein